MLNILIEGWFSYPHPYSIVCLHLTLELLKRGDMKVYVDEALPADASWPKTSIRDLLFDAERLRLLDTAQPLKNFYHATHSANAQMHLILRISFPFDISPPRFPGVPIVLFYASDFRSLRDDAFAGGTVESFVDKCRRKELFPITPSEWCASAMIKDHRFRPLVVHHGVDKSYVRISADERSAMRKDLSVASDAFVFLTVGSMSPNKNIKGTLKAFYQLTMISNDPVHLLLKGTPFDKSQAHLGLALKELVAEGCIRKDKLSSFKKQITFVCEPYNGKEMCALYNCADCYVSPYMAESFNLPVLESLACGVPVIVTKGGSTDDFTNAGIAKYVEAGSYVTAGDAVQAFLHPNPASILECMLSVMKDQEWRDNANVLAPVWVRERFTWNHAAEMIGNLFKHICWIEENLLALVQATSKHPFSQ